MRMLLAILLALPVSARGACPPPPDIAVEQAEMLAELQAAPSEMAARAPTAALWELWFTAPDQTAQTLLDTGVRARREANYSRATAAFDELVRYCPDYAEGYNQRAFVAFLTGDLGRALEDIDRTLARQPNHLGAMSGKVLTLMRLGRIRAAQGVLREALELNPWLPERRLLQSLPGDDI